jgi:hypothetical protein
MEIERGKVITYVGGTTKFYFQCVINLEKLEDFIRDSRSLGANSVEFESYQPSVALQPILCRDETDEEYSSRIELTRKRNYETYLELKSEFEE